MDAFRDLVLEAGNLACEEWGYPAVGEDWCLLVEGRLPAGLRAAFSDGVASGSIELVGGHRFTLSGLVQGKGPYALFSRSEKGRPAPNWEYFVQAAEFNRVRRAVNSRGLRVDFEDDLMDLSVYDAEQVLWCIEVKEKARQLGTLLQGVRANAPTVNAQRPDRGDDALRKSKYLVRHRPPYFSLVAIGARLDFSVVYRDSGFALTEDVIPFG
jgi:hypothetical protein